MISKATLESGRPVRRRGGTRQHASWSRAYEDAGVNCHFLEPDPALPYQVFARDSSVMRRARSSPSAHQCWRRGEYAPVIRFYQEAEIPIRQMVTAGAIEGGDVMIVEPGCVLIGNGEERTQSGGDATRRLVRGRGLGGAGRADPGHFVHIDVLVAVLGEKLAAVCVGAGFGSP